MAQASLFIQPDPQFFDSNGNPLAGGKLYFYEAGTTTPKTVYSDSAATTPLSNPVILDSSGRSKIWLDGYYYVVLTDSLGSQIWTENNVSSAYSPAAISPATISEWAIQADVLTFIGATQFSVTGDKTEIYLVGRRIKAIVTAGTITGTITASSAGGSPIITTITVLWDLAEALDAGLSSVAVGIITPIANSLPFQIPIGGVISWFKTLTGVPALPYGWVECNGAILSDPFSPLNGRTIPNINGLGYFVRGNAVSGTVQASQNLSHTHAYTGLVDPTHVHAISLTSASESVTHTHQASQNATSASGGGGVNGLLQNGAGGIPESTGTESATHTHSVVGNTAAAGTGITTLVISASTPGTPDESRPINISAVFIMRVK